MIEARHILVTLRMHVKGYADDGSLNMSETFNRQVLNVEFEEASYDHTCLAVQGMVDGFPCMVAGDEVRVEFIHAREQYSATFEGVMPRDERYPLWQEWKNFVHAVHMGTR